MRTQGRRRDDTDEKHIPSDIEPGDYWRVLDSETGEHARSDEPSNLTGGVWRIVVPMAEESGKLGIGYLVFHTVRERDDGTISVLPNDGSSNSILVSDHRSSWHGFVYEGVLDGEIGAGR